MEKVLGIGGVFFKTKDPKALGAWYREHLGIDVHPEYGFAEFEDGGKTVWTPFKADSGYFPGQLMVNYRVRDVRAMLAQVKAGGATVEEEVTDDDFGVFGHFVDPDGNRVELWQPK